VAAARTCFRREGVSKTWIATVANEAGIARQTLYTFVGGRRELIELALCERCRELLPIFAQKLGEDRPDTDAALVELMAIMVETCRADTEFVALASAMTREHAFAVLAGSSVLRSLVQDAFRSLFSRAEQEGRLRSDDDQAELAGWIQIILTPLAGRSDLDAASLRRTLRRFALPALVTPDSS
jgi:AcrR family transcriptional regulator